MHQVPLGAHAASVHAQHSLPPKQNLECKESEGLAPQNKVNRCIISTHNLLLLSSNRVELLFPCLFAKARESVLTTEGGNRLFLYSAP